MKVELTIDRTKKLPQGPISALESELFKRLNKRFDSCHLTIERASNEGLSIIVGDKKEVEHIMQETCESADEWFN